MLVFDKGSEKKLFTRISRQFQGSNWAYRDREMRSIFPLSRGQRNLILLFSIQNVVQNMKKHMWILFILLWSCLYGKWCLVECFHYEFRVSTQIMVRNYSITKCKFSTCGGILMAFGSFFLQFITFALIRTLQFFCFF